MNFLHALTIIILKLIRKNFGGRLEMGALYFKGSLVEPRMDLEIKAIK